MHANGLQRKSRAGTPYFSYFKHRGDNDKSEGCSVWAIEVDEEVEVFCLAERNEWASADGKNKWGLHLVEGARHPLGTQGEVVARFVQDSPVNPWHGYPVTLSSKFPKDYPDDEIINAWVDACYLSKIDRSRLRRGHSVC